MVTNINTQRRHRRKSPHKRVKEADTARFNRSALANGRILPHGIDGRSAAGRRWKEIYLAAMERSEGLSEQLCRSYASLVVERDSMDSDIAQGFEINRWELVRLTNAIDRLERRLGLDKPDDQDERERIARENAEALLP